MARGTKRYTPKEFEEPAETILSDVPARNAPPPATVYDMYVNVSYKELIEAHENMRAHLKRTLQTFETLEKIIKRERIEVENVLAATQVT